MTRQGDSGDVCIRVALGSADYSRLVEIWRSAVDATHDFLNPADRDEIQSRLAADYFPAVDLYVAEIGSLPAGFAGVAGRSLEMLFVDDAHRGRGVGSALLAYVIAVQDISVVDVNEQNVQALGFYLAKGFRVLRRSDVDDQGRPYPLLHLTLDRDDSAGS